MFIDPPLDKLALHIKTEINRIAVRYLRIELINGIRSYDAFNVPHHEYPLLKVFRASDVFKSESALNRSTVIIRYCLNYPDQESLAPLCSLIGKLIHDALNDLYTKIGIDIEPNERRCDYSTSENELGQPVKSFVNFYITIKESSKPLYLIQNYGN